MSAMPPPPPGNDPPGYQPAPAYSGQGGGAHVPASAPSSIVRAKYAMYAGAVLQLIMIALAFVGMDGVREQIKKSFDQQGMSYSESTVDNAVTVGIWTAVVIGVIGVILWLLMAWLNGAGKGWARIVATIFFALFIIFFLVGLGQAATVLTMILNILALIAGAVAIYFLWQKDSTAWFQAHKAPTV